MIYNNLSKYRIMWLFILYDLPTETKKDRKTAQLFRKKILAYGFNMFQFSAYIRHCTSTENAEMHKERIRKIIPEKGKIGVLKITDKQFADMEIYHGVEKVNKSPIVQQLEIW